MTTQRIAILGGTFDPPHNGHLALACGVADALSLDRVLLIPTGNPHFKLDQKVTSVEDRVAMTQLLAAEDQRLEVSRIEADRPGVTYTVDTLHALQEQNPDAELLFIIGGDCAEHIMKWRNADLLARQCTVVAVGRAGYDFAAARKAIDACGLGFKVEYFTFDVPDVSSTGIRAAAAAGEDITSMVPSSVAAYIAEHQLY